MLGAYNLLGEAVEDASSPAELDGRGWLLGDPLQLVEDRQERLGQAERELGTPVRLARHQGASWADISRVLEMGQAKAVERFADRP